MMKEEFEKHGFEIRNEFDFHGESHYDAVKDGIKLSVAEWKYGIKAQYKNKDVYVPKEMATWDRLVYAIQCEMTRLMSVEDARMRKALGAFKERKGKYLKVKEIFK